MSIVSCMVSNLPSALEKALTSVIGADKAEAFVEALLPIIKRDKWSIFHPIDDVDQLKSALQEAAGVVGIGWSTIADVAVATGLSVGQSCFGLDSMNSYFETLKSNSNDRSELETAITTAITETAKKQGHAITAEDLKNNAVAKGYANSPALGCENIAWTAICSR